jgi:hypothetical protein
VIIHPTTPIPTLDAGKLSGNVYKSLPETRSQRQHPSGITLARGVLNERMNSKNSESELKLLKTARQIICNNQPEQLCGTQIR